MQEDEEQYATGLRVLVVDDDPTICDQRATLLREWGHTPFIVVGQGQELLADAVRKAHGHRCQVALVDMRLIDNDDWRDWSGLELVPKLAPTAAIIVSGYGDRRAVVQALKEYGAKDFVGKDDDLLEIRRAIDGVARELHTGRYRPEVVWEQELSSAQVAELLFRGRTDIPPDEADEVVGRVFPGAERVVLSLITDDGETAISASPLHDAGNVLPRGASSSDQLSTLRRESRVFVAQVEGQKALHVVKLASERKIRHEVENYERHVRTGVATLFRPELVGYAFLWDIGAVVYRHVGGANERLGTLRTFRMAYQSAKDASGLLMPLRHFFDVDNCGGWYRDAEPLDQSLFDAYDTIWNGALSQAYLSWRNWYATLLFHGLPARLPNPMRWLYENADRSEEVKQARRAVTHGDLHGDNLFVNTQHAWPIDFERTGPGPILRDFVELIQDVTTRIAQFDETDLPILYELAVVVCAPQVPSQLISATPAILDHAEARKVFEVVAELLKLAHEQAGYQDRRELLWSLLLNNLFVVSRLKDGGPRWLRTVLFASVICGRLDHWDQGEWPPQAWPAVGQKPTKRLQTRGIRSDVSSGRAVAKQHPADEAREITLSPYSGKEHRRILRQLVAAALSEEDVRTFVFDYFLELEEKFGDQMSKETRVRTLVGYCIRQGKVEALLAAVKAVNEYQYNIYRPQLESL